MSILDASVNVGLETTYGTPVTMTRSFEAKADSWVREQSRLESVGFRANMQALRSDRVRTVNMGGAGSIELDFMTNGMGTLLGSTLGSKAIAQQAATAAWLQTYATTDSAPGESLTIQVQRPKLESGLQSFTHHGATITGWGLSQSVDGLLVFNADFDSEDVDISTGDATPAYASGVPFDWTQCVVTLDPDGSPETLDAKNFTFNADLGLKTDRRYLRASALKKQPVRTGVPSYSGSLSVDFTGTERYAEWTAETDLDLEVKWTGATIEGAHNQYLNVRMKAVNWTSGNPVSSLSDIGNQQLDFQVMHDATSGDAVTMTYMSSDVAY